MSYWQELVFEAGATYYSARRRLPPSGHHRYDPGAMGMGELILSLATAQGLWSIGAADHTSEGLYLGPSGYPAYTEDAYYVVGMSRPETDWPYVHPGPSDAWAGSKQHTFEIWFGLSAQPEEDCALSMDLLDTHGTLPPRIQIAVNGVRVDEFETPPGSGGERALEGDVSRGKPFAARIRVPRETLRQGDNVVSISNVQGSWAVYDCVRLDAPEGTKLAPVSTHLTVDPLPTRAALNRTAEGPRQSLALRITYRGEPTEAEISLDGIRHDTVGIRPGRQTVRTMVPPVEEPTTRRVRVQTGQGLSAEQEIEEKPTRRWDVYILPHSHVDVGYTTHQSVALSIHRKNLLDASRLAEATRYFPEGARFRWNCETFWALDDLRRNARDSEWMEVAQSLWRGALHPDASYAHLLSGLARPEELLRSFRMSRLEADRVISPSDAAMLVDVPGASWGIVTAMAHAGVRYLLLAPNNSDRIGRVRVAWENKPFYWMSPSGKERVLVWQTEPYSLATSLKTGPNRWGYANVQAPPEPVSTEDPLKHFLDPWLFDKLSGLESEHYPYDMLLITWALADNSPIDPDLPEAVRRWNEIYESPRLVIATTSEAMREFERRYGPNVPRVSGDYSPYWEEGAASSARETALNRASAERLIQAETLWAMTAPANYPAEDVLDAWRNVLLYTEHTWGAHSSVWDPDSEFARKQWETKRSYALAADAQSRRLLQAALDARPGRRRYEFDVYNTSSWSRTDLVSIPRPWSLVGDRVEAADGTPVPSQRLANGDLAFLAANVPPFATKRFRVVAGAPFSERSATVTGTSLQNEFYHVTLDGATGDIASIVRLADGWQIVNDQHPHRFNQYLYVLGADTASATTSGKAKIEVVDGGPLVVSLRVTSSAPGARYLTREIRLTAGTDRIDITNTVWKRRVREKEGVHFAFPFAVESGQVRFDTAWAVVTPEAGQLPGANKNFLSVQHWVDVSNPSKGVTLSSPDAPIVELGSLSGNLIGSQTDPEAWIAALPPTQTVYSWVMNNHWHTNYRADQEGETTFRYSLRAHSGFDPGAEARWGLETSCPLVVARSAEREPEGLPFTVDTAGAIVTALKPSDDRKGWIVRLFAASGQDEQVRLLWRDSRLRGVWETDAREAPGNPTSDEIVVPAWGVRSLYIER